MNYIEEFVPLELIMVFDHHDLPDYYMNLLKPYLINRKNINQTTIQIIHWEWKHNSLYDLLIDIVFNPGDHEHGIICHDNEIIYHNKKQKLTIVDNFLENRLSSFEHLRMLKYHENHKHCLTVYNDIKEMESELLEEDVSEEEYLELEKPYMRPNEDSGTTSDSTSNNSTSSESSNDVSSVSE